jgi:multiphosphoryl transfer protein
MIGLVIVSHSAKLAEGVGELARQVARDKVGIACAGGTAEAENPIGTDAVRVLEAIEAVYSEEGVLVLMDLGSAVLSAGTALEFLAEEQRGRVRLCSAPLVEGAVAAASLAAAGAGLEEIEAEARNALAGKASQLGEKAGPVAASGFSPDAGGEWEEASVMLVNPLGLHARPAARLIRMARRWQARITLENLTRGTGAAPADSINGVLWLGAQRGHRVRVRARGVEARPAVAMLADFLASGCDEGAGGEVEAPQRASAAASQAAGQLTGIAGSAGIAIGPLVSLQPLPAAVASAGAADPGLERQRLLAAVDGAREETKALYGWAQAHTGADEAGIFDAQLLFLEDATLIGGAIQAIESERVAAEAAWIGEIARVKARLGALGDAFLGARAADVADLGARVLRRLSGQSGALEAPGQPSILRAHDVTPSQVKDLDPAVTLGLCLEAGSANAHSTILARALGIPVVAGLGPGIATPADGSMVAIDGEVGTVWVAPDAAVVQALEERRGLWLAARAAAEAVRLKPAAMQDGRRIRVLANISAVEEAAEAVACGADGVGVLRTEFLFLGRAEAPGEEEQTAAYRAIAESLAGRTLTVRVLDIGGDKRLPYVEIGEEANPFLGWRGIRVLMGRPDLFRTQVRAILRAGVSHPVEVLLPMIASLEELRWAKAAVREAEAELEREGVPFHRGVRVGTMIEVPAAVMVAPQLAREAAYFSIGSNDLIQYSLAVDRSNPRVASIADPFQPGVLRLIRQTIEAGREAGIEVALCGELAADPLATPLLLGLGLEEFSVSAALIPALKVAIARWSAEEAADIARQALAMDSAGSVRRFLRERTGYE